jgi:hypothetical protein
MSGVCCFFKGEETMKEARFRVVFTGRLAPGMTRRQVRANLAKMSHFTAQALDLFFSRQTVIRSGIDRKAAWRCWDLFRRAGALCSVEPLEPVASCDMISTLAEVEIPRALCPCCRTPQGNTAICTTCGVDMAICRLTAQPEA